MAYIFLDESGQFTKNGKEEYFVVGSFMIGDPRRIEKRFRSWQRNRFPRKMRTQSEIKYSDNKISPKLKLKTLKYIADLDVRIKYIYLKRTNIPVDFRKKSQIDSGELYTQMIGELLEMYLPIADTELRIFCDRRHLKGITQSDFKKRLTARLLSGLPKNSILQVESIDSTTNANIQIADWITGSISGALEGKLLGNECLEILKNNIIDSKELFKDHWENSFAK